MGAYLTDYFKGKCIEKGLIKNKNPEELDDILINKNDEKDDPLGTKQFDKAETILIDED
jgi:hypothetical protein